MPVVVVPRLVVVVDGRHVGVGEDVREYPPAAADARLQFAVRAPLPAALPTLLIFPLFGIADTGFGFDVVEPGVLDALARCPHVFARDRAGVAPEIGRASCRDSVR